MIVVNWNDINEFPIDTIHESSDLWVYDGFATHAVYYSGGIFWDDDTQYSISVVNKVVTHWVYAEWPYHPGYKPPWTNVVGFPKNSNQTYVERRLAQ